MCRFPFHHLGFSGVFAVEFFCPKEAARKKAVIINSSFFIFDFLAFIFGVPFLESLIFEPDFVLLYLSACFGARQFYVVFMIDKYL